MRLALAGERLPADLLALLEAAGLPAAPLRTAAGSALIPAGEVEWVLAPEADVVQFCVLAGVDAAIVGEEVLFEHDEDICELLDLGVARRRLVYAGVEGRVGRRRTRLATRYPNIVREHFLAHGRDVRILPVADAPWLSVTLGLADGVVEREDRLPQGEPPFVVREVLRECGARLIAGRQPRALHGQELAWLVEGLRRAKGEL